MLGLSEQPEGAAMRRDTTQARGADDAPALVYTVHEVAERLRVSPGTVRNMIASGQLYAVRLHVRRIVIPAWALEEVVARPALRSVPAPSSLPRSS
jgi:excisionase family DNA binding protein